MSNIRTMEFIGLDDWGHDVYKCIETGILYKDGRIGEHNEPELCSCGNEIDGELCYPIKNDFKLTFIKPEQPTREEKFNYQLLDRLVMDCKYYLGNGNRYKKHLWAGDEQKQIDKMKELYSSFSDDKKPEWLTYGQILHYEKLMVNN